jgi:hypothetical protein
LEAEAAVRIFRSVKMCRGSRVCRFSRTLEGSRDLALDFSTQECVEFLHKKGR